jgi:hypothetical protein
MLERVGDSTVAQNLTLYRYLTRGVVSY